MGFFSYLYYKIFTSKTDTTYEDEEEKKKEKIKEKRIRLLPFAWKYRIKCDTKKELQKNLKKTEDLSEKCEILHDSAKTYQELTKQLSEKYKQ